MNTPRIRLVHCDTLSCEPILRRMPDGFFENGHILFTIEINRHEILFFDCEM